MEKNNLEFKKEIFKKLKQVKKGFVTTYKGLARSAGYPNAARGVGKVLNQNTKLIIIPCHRVVMSSGRVGGYKKGKLEKIKLLRSEGIVIDNGRIKNFKDKLFNFSKIKN